MTALWIILGVILIVVVYTLIVYKATTIKPPSEFKTTSNDKYLVSFKVSYPLSNGTHRETKPIDVVIVADSPHLAKDLAKKKALSKVQITIVDVEIKN